MVIVMDDTRRQTSSVLLFWAVCLMALAAVVAAIWDVMVVYVGPLIEAVREAYF